GADHAFIERMGAGHGARPFRNRLDEALDAAHGEAAIPLRLDVEGGVFAERLGLARHDHHGHLVLHGAVDAHASLQHTDAGVQQHRLRPSGHQRVAGGHVDRERLVPGLDEGRAGLVVELLTRQRLPDGRPFRARRGHDVVDLELAKRLEDRLAPVEIVLHLVLACAIGWRIPTLNLSVCKPSRAARGRGLACTPASRQHGGRGLTFGRPRRISDTALPAIRPQARKPSRQDVVMKPARKTLRRPDELVAAGFIAHERRGEIEAVAAALSVAGRAHDLTVPADPRDPIARQFVPAAAELDARPEEMADPIGDDAHSPLEGIVHRYPDRVLLKPVHVCAAYCRFCFRREVVGRAGALSRAQLDAAMAYIRSHREIWEVILTGGDPLVLSPRRLGQVVETLAAIDHVKIIRVHTRVPVVAPARVTAALVRALRAPGKATYVVLHANHARELTSAARAACARLVDAGIPMLSQTVLLRGVNDEAAVLGELMRALVECR